MFYSSLRSNISLLLQSVQLLHCFHFVFNFCADKLRNCVNQEIILIIHMSLIHTIITS
jgi:hypothetical protein